VPRAASQPNSGRTVSHIDSDCHSQSNTEQLGSAITEAGVQFYTANFYDRSNSRKKIHGGTGIKHSGDGYGPGAGAFLEFHEPLAAFLDQNKDTVRSGYDTLLGPGEVYNNWVRLDVLTRSVPDDSL
jgi:aldose 1-epimerase